MYSLIDNVTTTVWFGLVIFLSLITIVAIWSRTNNRLRAFSVFLFILIIPTSGALLLAPLGRPIPYVNGVTIPSGDWAVLGAKIEQNKAIYVLIDLGRRPVFAVLPWSAKQASQIQDIMDDPELKDGMRIEVLPYAPSLEDRPPPRIYAKPQPKLLPPKPSDHQEEPPAHLDTI